MLRLWQHIICLASTYCNGLGALSEQDRAFLEHSIQKNLSVCSPLYYKVITDNTAVRKHKLDVGRWVFFTIVLLNGVALALAVAITLLGPGKRHAGSAADEEAARSVQMQGLKGAVDRRAKWIADHSYDK